MALTLKPSLKTELQKALIEGLDHTLVNYDRYLDSNSHIFLAMPNVKLPKEGKLQKNLNKYISDWPLADFIIETLSRELYENNEYNPENKATPLKNFSKYNNLETTANRIIDEFETLPWSYIVTLELPFGIGKPIKDTQISYNLNPFLKITVPNDESNSLYPFKSGIENRDKYFSIGTLITGITDQSWNQETANIQISTEGFIGFFGNTNPMVEAEETLKSILGLSLAIGLMKVEKNSLAASLRIGPAQSSFFIHKKINSEWQIWSKFELHRDFAETLYNLRINDNNGKTKSDILKKHILDGFNIISIPFKTLDRSERILRAAQWFFDGHIGSNELLSFLQTMVALEILLGEKSNPEKIGLGELLRNRCAYLIGKSFNDRDQILKDFNTIYEVRSNIVHRGKSRLNTDERVMFNKLRRMCRSVILKELELINNDYQKDKK